MSGGHLCKAEAPTEAAAETLPSETRLRERNGKAFMYLSLSLLPSRLREPPPSDKGAKNHRREPIRN